MQEPNIPWYKEFWPWFLISIPATSVVLSFFMLTKAMQSGLSVVNDNYYKDGLAINKTLDDIEQAEQLAISAEITFKESELILTLKGNRTLNLDTITILFSHPINQTFDRSIMLTRQGTFYTGLMPEIEKGKWYLDLVATGEDAFRLKTVFFHPAHNFSFSG